MKPFFLLFFVGFSFQIFAQNPLDEYLKQGLENNLVLKEKNISLQKSMLALQEAKTLFLPSVNFSGYYTTAQGGRTIALPLGDMLNPVYSTLNQLTKSDRFPQIQNVSEQFFPVNFYDARVKTTMPILNTDISYNRQIKEHEIRLQTYEVEIYQQELALNIKQAYFNYGMSLEAIKIFQSAMALVEQNLKANQSLLRNGKGLPASVLRAESEVENVRTKLLEQENQKRNAQFYFNFLLNRPLTDSIDFVKPALPSQQVDNQTFAATERSEMKKLETGISLTKTVLKMNKNFRVPKIGLGLDLGSQGINFAFNDKSVFYLAALQIDMPIFNGKRNLYKIRQTELQLDALNNQKTMVEQQLNLGNLVAKNNLGTSWANLALAEKQFTAAQAYFRLLEKGYAAGTNSLIEFIDARNQLTNSELQVSLNQFKVLKAQAEYERQLGKK